MGCVCDLFIYLFVSPFFGSWQPEFTKNSHSDQCFDSLKIPFCVFHRKTSEHLNLFQHNRVNKDLIILILLSLMEFSRCSYPEWVKKRASVFICKTAKVNRWQACTAEQLSASCGRYLPWQVFYKQLPGRNTFRRLVIQ